MVYFRHSHALFSLRLHVLALVAAASTMLVFATPPATVGVFNGYTRRLPSTQLPAVPLLGNGALGVLLDAHDNVHASAGSGRDNTIDMWLSSTSFWSCGTCSTLAKGCCRLVSLGGLSLSALPTFPRATQLSFYAEQRIGKGQLFARLSTSNGGNFSAIIFMHPSQSVVVANLSWTPGPGDPVSLAINTSLWVTAATSNGANPSPTSVGCIDAATRLAQACAANVSLGSQLIFASRKAATKTDSPYPVWAGLAARYSDASDVGSFAVTASTAVGVWESTISATLQGGKLPISLLIGEVEATVNTTDPAIAAAALITAATPAIVTAAAEQWWSQFWKTGASVTFPANVVLESLWNGAQYLLGATASTDATVPPPGLYGVWATSDDCSWCVR